MTTPNTTPQPAPTSKRAALAAMGLMPSKSIPSFAHAKWEREGCGAKRSESSRG